VDDREEVVGVVGVDEEGVEGVDGLEPVGVTMLPRHESDSERGRT
jgi:hypothetical protein